MDRIRNVLAVLVVSTIPPGVIWWYMVHPFVDFWRRLGPKVTLWVVGASMICLMVVLILLRRHLVGADLGTHWEVFAAGVVCAGIAVAMGVRRKRYLTQRILAGIPELSVDGPGTLITEGPYAIIRHPRYVEVWIGVVGHALMANYVGGYVVALLIPPALHLVVLLEERELATRFGAVYASYRARVPRYVPAWSRPGVDTDTGSDQAAS